jgi:hypothetical protein
VSGIVICTDQYDVDENGDKWVYSFFSNFEHLPDGKGRDGILQVKTCPKCGGELRSIECRGQNPVFYTFSHYEGGDWWGQECPPPLHPEKIYSEPLSGG